MKIKLKGFTLVELIITIAIIVIVSLISAPLYTGYVQKARFAEGYNLLAEIREAQIRYYNERRTFLAGTNINAPYPPLTTEYMPVLEVSARGNSHFRNFNIGFWGVSAMKWSFSAFVTSNRGEKINLSYDITSGAT